MLEIWGRADSSNVQAVMWCVGELGLPFLRHDVGQRYGGTDTPDFIAMNPNRKIPVLRDGGGPALWESAAIMRYLAGSYGHGAFWPEDLVARSEVDRWAEWAKINVAIPFMDEVFFPLIRRPAAERDPAAIARAVTDLEQTLGIAESRLAEHPYLVGSDFSLADILLGHVLYRYYDIDIARAELPALAAYYQRLTERPPFREHVMIGYDALRAG
ncbi:glutathione S-transferase family protein [Tropicimonas sp. IMCC34043]|uniref:glutathione S-transferase family protein n=1 Tax=Tropicimonas sp. IMCC34043 TaxID=2248760 RepID=UPI000E24B83A|nr:glutathione S-transferase family protein [Tropicimonas sp. IMCC34043]